MQRPLSQPVSIPWGAAVLVGIASIALVGCDATTPATSTAVAKRPFAGLTVSVACRDATLARQLTDRTAGWAGKTGATVRVEARPVGSGGEADVLIIRPTELGEWAARGDLAPMPADMRSGDNAVQWTRIAFVYRADLPGWAGEVMGLPIAGDGYALVYRADKFGDEKHRRAFADQYKGRSLEPPATWEDMADVAAYFAGAEKKPSLPALPGDPLRFTTHFQQLAACYDSPALSDATQRRDGVGTSTSFHIQAGNWQPRLATPGFVAAARWFGQTKPYRTPGTSDDPVAALDSSAVMAVLTLAEIAKLPKESGQVAKRFKVAPLPATRMAYDSDGQPRPAGRQGNYIPLLGAGGWIGVVPKKSANAAAAWDLLADLGGPTGSLTAVSATGVGPFRPEHVSPERQDVWLGYGFDANGTQALFTAMDQYLGSKVSNPALALRTPDQAAVMAILDAEVRKAANGESSPEAAMGRADEAWRQLDAKRPADELIRWRRNAVGLP